MQPWDTAIHSRTASALPVLGRPHNVYFEPKDEEFRPPGIHKLESIPQFKTTAKLGEFLEVRFSQPF